MKRILVIAAGIFGLLALAESPISTSGGGVIRGYVTGIDGGPMPVNPAGNSGLISEILVVAFCGLSTSNLIWYGTGINGTGLWTAGAWNFVALIATTSTYRQCVNGVCEPTTNIGVHTFIANFFANSGGPDPLKGAIDEIGMWKRALTTAEITQLYNGGAGLQYPF